MKNYMSPKVQLEILKSLDVITLSLVGEGGGDDWDVGKALGNSLN